MRRQETLDSALGDSLPPFSASPRLSKPARGPSLKEGEPSGAACSGRSHEHRLQESRVQASTLRDEPRPPRLTAALMTLLLLSACRGGAGGSDPSPPNDSRMMVGAHYY